ncbi:MAG: 6-carboxytetrahydropterin synthase [Lachnospiraceae bacterium]|nr:6-carboxytetrahydropterin synthase [Lachnospiraceae bacterium]
MQKYYKCQYRFNATHSFDYVKEHEHQHTFTLTLYLTEPNPDTPILFTEIDKAINAYLKPYRHCILNELPQFAEQVPNIENLGDFFFGDIRKLLKEYDIKLHQLDICENPLCIYQVSDRIHLANPHKNDLEKLM